MSQHLPTQSIQMGQVEPLSSRLDSSIQMGIIGLDNTGPLKQMSMANMQTGMMGTVSIDALSQQTSALNNQAQPSEPIPSNCVLLKLPVSNLHVGQMDPRENHPKREQLFVHNNVGSQQSSLLTKRKAPLEPSSNNNGLQKPLMPNKRVAQKEYRPWLQHLLTQNKLPLQSQSISSPSGLQRSQAMSKKPTSSKAGLQQLPFQKNQSGQSAPKVQSESSNSVRAKLRESLSAGLALVSMQQDTASGKSSKNEVDGTTGSMQENSKSSGHDFGTADGEKHGSEYPPGYLCSKEDPLGQKCNNDHSTAQEVSSNNTGDCALNSENDGRATISARDEDTSFGDCFFGKDELLQGNGLSWVLEPDMGMAENKDIETAENQPDLEDSSIVSGGQAVPSPEIVASKIEAELYKLFGGVNKKYREKGRSLSFNLKDPNNPELRARVMSGETPPERLCLMTPEELASKELSEWRMAKAEELAQMVVLPDSDVAMRRLVKKTHKGEFQVEVEPDDSVFAEVAIGNSSLTRMPPKPKEEASSPSKHDQVKDKGNAANGKSSSDDQNVLMIHSNETDLMQGLIVDDELKDAEFLPPIVSLDEFMESLNSEPPFENLPGDSGKKSPFVSDKDDSQVGSGSKFPDATIRDHDDTSSKPDMVDLTQTRSDTDGKSTDKHVKSETVPPVRIPKGENVWEGILQLNISAMASVIGIFKSGEKTSAEGWPGLVEIKGRVRLDAFEKFLQELPMSRSRAVMAVHFVCKEGSTESELSGLSEVADSYVTDSRVGFGEPSPGVELYLCPPHSKTREMLGKVIPKEQVDTLNAIDNGLIGVIVWRKPQITSTISPNSASHHKHNSKKQHVAPRRHQEKDANLNVNITAKRPSHASKAQPEDNDDDDLPPGFGPPATRDEDDLPEFNFSSGSVTPRSQFSTTRSVNQGQGMAHFHKQSQTHSRPVDQMRELVHRYGQPKPSTPSSGNWQDKRSVGVVGQPWDDDDDMPEWRPEENKPQASHPHPHPRPVHVLGIQQPISRANMIQETQHQQMAQATMPLQPMLRPNLPQEPPQQMAQPAMPLHPQMNMIHGPQNTALSWQQGPWMVQQNSAPAWQQGPWVAPNAGSHDLPVYQPNSGQFYGTPGLEAGQQGVAWRRDAPASRGF